MKYSTLAPWLVALASTPGAVRGYAYNYENEAGDGDRLRMAEAEFDWESIEPSTKLIFHPCFNDLQCARLDVPMDYNRTDGKGSRVALAVVRKPALVDVTDIRYGGPVLENPGGPGGPGVSLVQRYGNKTQAIVSAEHDPNSDESTDDDKYFDIVSWDPRATGATTPHLVCFPYAQNQLLWSQTETAIGIPDINAIPQTFDKLFSLQLALVSSCSGRLIDVPEDEDSLIENVNTATVVADMVSIIEAFGEWREEQAKQIIAARNAAQSQQVLSIKAHESEAAILERTKWVKGEEKLLYWGFSYGTIVGATFAAMQPHRVSRVAIDGVADADEYYTEQLVASSLTDTDKEWDTFFDLCAKAGKEKCPFNTGDSTPEQLRLDYEEIYNNITARPLPIIKTDQNGTMFDVVTASDLTAFLFTALYKPIDMWPKVAQILHDLRSGNGTLLSAVSREPPQPTEWCPAGGCTAPFQPACRAQSQEMRVSEIAILCADALNEVPAFDIAREKTFDAWMTLREASVLGGDAWSILSMFLPGWKAKSKWPVPMPIAANTSEPLLIIGNTLDPVTPLKSAKKAHAKFPGSALLTQDSQGHCSLAAPSLCTAAAIRAYFQTGALPEEGLVCAPDVLPLIGEVSESVKTMSASDKALMDALHDLRHAVVPLNGARF